MSKVRCSLSYHSSKVNDLPVFAGGVRDGVFGNLLVFATPPFTMPDFQLVLDSYNNTRYAYEQGGLAQKGPYLEAKNALMARLDELAAYVNSIALGNANTITLAGFVPTKGNRSDVPAPSVPTDVQLKRGVSGQLLAECAPQNNVLNYGCILTADGPLPSYITINASGQLTVLKEEKPTNGDESNLAAASEVIATAFIDFNPGRKKQFQNLKPGKTYYVTFYAANASGVSPLSKAISLMCG